MSNWNQMAGVMDGALSAARARVMSAVHSKTRLDVDVRLGAVSLSAPAGLDADADALLLELGEVPPPPLVLSGHAAPLTPY